LRAGFPNRTASREPNQRQSSSSVEQAEHEGDEENQ
jgi:hypothetical protein